MDAPYRIKPFGTLVIPKDWCFYTSLPARLANAGNEAALSDLLQIVARVRRSRASRYHALLGAREMPNLGGITKSLKGTER